MLCQQRISYPYMVLGFDLRHDLHKHLMCKRGQMFDIITNLAYDFSSSIEMNSRPIADIAQEEYFYSQSHQRNIPSECAWSCCNLTY